MDTSKEFEDDLMQLAQGLGHADRHAGLNEYCSGLTLPLSRKNVEPVAAPQTCAGASSAKRHVADSITTLRLQLSVALTNVLGKLSA